MERITFNTPAEFMALTADYIARGYEWTVTGERGVFIVRKAKL